MMYRLLLSFSSTWPNFTYQTAVDLLAVLLPCFTFISFVGEFQELLDPQNGYVKGGSVTLEVHLVADDPEGLWWCNCTIQHGHALSAKMCLHVPSTKFWIRPSQHKVASYFLKTETGSLCNSYPYQPLVKTHNGEKECLLNSVRQKRKMHALR